MKRLILGAGIAMCEVPTPTKAARKNTLEDVISCTLCGSDALKLTCPDSFSLETGRTPLPNKIINFF